MKKFILPILIICLLSCKDDGPQVDQIDLNGQWNFIKATRNGKETKTLESGFFIFDNNSNTLKSNIFQGDKSKQYEFKNGIIDIGGENPMQFQIAYLHQDTMVLTGKMWKFNMEFLLLKQDTIAPDSILFE